MMLIFNLWFLDTFGGKTDVATTRKQNVGPQGGSSVNSYLVMMFSKFLKGEASNPLNYNPQCDQNERKFLK